MRKFYILFFAFALIFITKIDNVFAKEKVFVSLRADSVNMRTGPNIQNPIIFTYNRKDLPMEVVDEYDSWYKLKDYFGDTGWVNKNLTSKKQTALILGGIQIIFKSDDLKSNPVVRLEEGVVVEVKKCKNDWCKIKIDDYTGWIEKNVLWGGVE
jgi:SH3-like domain-containing protein